MADPPASDRVNRPATPRGWRKSVSTLVFALLILSGIHPFFLEIWIMDRTAVGLTLRHHVDARSPGLDRFLSVLRQQTTADERIFFISDPDAEGGWARMRAVYFLHDRRITLAREDAFNPAEPADVIAIWGSPGGFRGYVPVAKLGSGTILRREAMAR